MISGVACAKQKKFKLWRFTAKQVDFPVEAVKLKETTIITEIHREVLQRSKVINADQIRITGL